MTTFIRKNYLIGRRIRRERTMWSLTQEELADRLGISANYLGQIERGTRELSRKMEYRLCNLFCMTHDDLYGEAEADRQDIPPDADHVAESGHIFHDLSERDLHRLLHSCTPEELQLCGHLIRSLLHYTRVYGKEISCLSPDFLSFSGKSARLSADFIPAENPAARNPADGDLADRKPADRSPAAGTSADGDPADRNPADRSPAAGTPVARIPAGNPDEKSMMTTGLTAKTGSAGSVPVNPDAAKNSAAAGPVKTGASEKDADNNSSHPTHTNRWTRSIWKESAPVHRTGYRKPLPAR